VWWVTAAARPGGLRLAFEDFSGPGGGTVGQQPWRDGATVREEQEFFRGWTPDHGYLEMRARGIVTPRSMVAWWMVGLEDVPDRCAEIYVTEMFGDAVEPGRSAAVGMGLHPFRDPAVTEDFEAVRLPIDLADPVALRTRDEFCSAGRSYLAVAQLKPPIRSKGPEK
jgi:hypothetical protein